MTIGSIIFEYGMRHDNCEYCNGGVEERKIRVDYRTGKKLIVVENVPVGVCEKCGERYYDAKVLRRLETIAKKRKKAEKMILVPIKRYDEAMSL